MCCRFFLLIGCIYSDTDISGVNIWDFNDIALIFGHNRFICGHNNWIRPIRIQSAVGSDSEKALQGIMKVMANDQGAKGRQDKKHCQLQFMSTV